MATMWYGSQIGAVGLEDETFTRAGCDHLQRFAGVFKRDRTVETQIEAFLQEDGGGFDTAGIAMEHAGDLAKRSLGGNLSDNRQAVGRRFAVMDDYWQIQFLGHFELGAENVTLDIARREIIVIVQTDLSNGHDEGAPVLDG